MIRVGIVDDHPVFRLGLLRAIEREPDLNVVWELGAASQAIPMLRQKPVDVVLMDLNLGPDEDALTTTRAIRERFESVKVIVISASLEWEAVAVSRNAGACGYLPKDLSSADMMAAIRGLATHYKGADAAKFEDRLVPRRPADSDAWASRQGLTRREIDVLRELRRGSTNREIAKQLGVSITTVNKHVQQVLKKLQVRTRAQAVARMHAENWGSRYTRAS